MNVEFGMKFTAVDPIRAATSSSGESAGARSAQPLNLNLNVVLDM